ncbi:MAG: YqeG family HAD IIIA-type phosphatase [Oscillospiraceae bacterium]|jgi:HAD superfamily phosphatase (TIGR01668 family)|nr:YqeG family HAD IIIA-type phosphatase [Oscillospiraceae bacterium]
MSVLPLPEYKFRELRDISADFLARRGIELLMLDLDNTIAPYGRREPESGVLRWAEEIRASGVLLYIVSNSRGEERVRSFAAALGIPYTLRAKKPSPRKPREIMRATGVGADRAALVGDQIYTDVLAARLAGITPILVRPIELKNPLLAIRYALEAPFRIWGSTYEQQDK